MRIRYFSESLDGEEIFNPDQLHGEIKLEQNPITFEYKVTQNAVIERNKVVKVYKNEDGSIKGKEIQDVVSEPEQGEWRVYDTRKGEKEDITDSREWDFYNCQDKNLIYEGLETVGIYHTFTEEEQAKFDRELEKEYEQKELEKFNKEQLKELPEFEDDTAGSVCELYELILALSDALCNTGKAIEKALKPVLVKLQEQYSKIAKMYARRILAGEITLDDVPEPIRDEVRRILEEN